MLPMMVLGAVLSGLAPAVTDPYPQGVWPLDPTRVVAVFEAPPSDYGAGHRGVDLAGTSGAWVRAALPGRVTFSGVIAGRGVVVVDHGGTRTTYEPVAGLLEPGSNVAVGQVIGRLQLLGSHCYPDACLHWGWRRGSTYFDPLQIVGSPGPVRLWPWEHSGGGPQASSPAAGPAVVPWQSLIERWAQARIDRSPP